MVSILAGRGQRILGKISRDWFGLSQRKQAAMASKATPPAPGSSGHLVRFVEDGVDGKVVFGLAPASYRPDQDQLVGQVVQVVEVGLDSLKNHKVDWWNREQRFGSQTTGHVSPVERLIIQPTSHTAKIGALLAPLPVPSPPSIWCIGLNYMKHYEEGAAKRGEPLPSLPSVFMKPPSSVAHPAQPVWIPDPGATNDPFSLGGQGGKDHLKVDYEGELAVVIGRACRNVAPDQVYSGGYVLGWSAANDISQRHWQRNAGGGQWIRGKSFDTFCPIGPVLTLATDGRDPDLAITTTVNGEIRQSSRTGDMIFPVSELVSYLSRSTTLLPGTVILTGTPQGVGYARKEGPLYLTTGDNVVVQIQGIGKLTNIIQNEPTSRE